jgi:glutamate 5-kinase
MDAVSALTGARLVVVKVGSALVAEEHTGAPDRAWLDAFARDSARLKARGQGLVVVSSGAVALGRRRLGLADRALSLPEKQAAAAAGQSLLMAAWQEAMAPLGIAVAQILLTADDTEARRRFLNARATVGALIELGVLPIVNENDTVATEELRYGDNDRLAARVAQMAGADLLVLLSDVDGLYTADPRRVADARRLERVEAITPAIEAMAGGANAERRVGSGGMVTKLAAARMAAAAGCATLITLGRRDAPLGAVEAGAAATLIEPLSTPAAAYKAWIAGSLAPHGALTIDNGAAAAIRAGKSLLAAGVTAAQGRFGKGDAVVVRDLTGREIGRGLARYDAVDARRILGLRSEAIEALLGEAASPLVHADDLALGSQPEPAA